MIMVARSRTVLALVALLILAPTLAVVLITALLLFGADPHLVFLPGHIVKSGLAAVGFHAPNRIGVIVTFVFWWGIIALVWLAMRWRWRR